MSPFFSPVVQDFLDIGLLPRVKRLTGSLGFVFEDFSHRRLRPLRPARRPSRGAGLAIRYSRVLEGSLARPFLTGGIAAGFVLAGVLLGLRLDTGFLPEADEGSYVIDYFAPVGASMRG